MWYRRNGLPELAGMWLAGSDRFAKFLKWAAITILVVTVLLLNRTCTWHTITNTVATTATAVFCFAIYFGAIGLLLWPAYLLENRWRWVRVVINVLWAQTLGSIVWALIWHHTPTPEGAGDLATHSAMAFIVAALIGWTAAAIVLFSVAFLKVTGKAADRIAARQQTAPPAAPPAAWPAPNPAPAQFQRLENLPTMNWQQPPPPDDQPGQSG